jgi:hypothetical protein
LEISFLPHAVKVAPQAATASAAAAFVVVAQPPATSTQDLAPTPVAAPAAVPDQRPTPTAVASKTPPAKHAPAVLARRHHAAKRRAPVDRLVGNDPVAGRYYEAHPRLRRDHSATS